MSLDVLTAIWKDPPCKAGDLLCLLAIADNADENGYSWPSISTIARKAAMSERGAQKCLKKLAKLGLISINPGGRARQYQCLPDHHQWYRAGVRTTRTPNRVH